MKKSSLAIMGLFLLIYILPLGMRPIIIPDEFRYAEIPREMISSGDWVVPHLNGLRYFEKPALGHWLDALASPVWRKRLCHKVSVSHGSRNLRPDDFPAGAKIRRRVFRGNSRCRGVPHLPGGLWRRDL